MKTIYLDHNATTYLHDDVLQAMMPYMTQYYANPSSIYRISQNSKLIIEDCRQNVLNIIGDEDGQLIFTGSGSESDNLAIKGYAFANMHRGKHLITSATEHHAVLNAVEYLEKYHDFEATYLPVDQYGIVSVKDLEAAIRKDTILVSIMYANNETGTLQPIKELAAVCRGKKIFFHTDAVQVIGRLDVDVLDMGVDALTLSAHKFYGPKGVGALYLRKGIRLHSQIHGGEQEHGQRAGTENVAGIVGLSKALALAMEILSEESKREQEMRDALEIGIKERIPEIMMNGHPQERLPNTLNVIIKYVEGESMLIRLDDEGVCASSGSACTSGSLDPSHVLLAMGVTHEFAHGSLRFSFGKCNTLKDVEHVLNVLPGIVKQLRAMSPLWEG